MQGPVIVALDGSEKDGRAVAVGTAMVRLSHRDAHLVRVVANPLAGVVRDPRDEVVGLRVAEAVSDAVTAERDDAEAQLAEIAATLQAEQGLTVTTAVLQSQDAAPALIEHAIERDALLMVLATRAPGARSRALAGSVADHVMRDCPRPVVLVPPGAAFMAGRSPTIARVLVPLDDSSLAMRSLEFAVALPGAKDLEYVLLEVVGDEGSRDTAQTRIDHSATWLRSRGARHVEARAVVAPHAGDAIVHAVRETLVDAIIMSTRGSGGLTRMILGSVAEHVVRHSELPVMLLTPRVLAQP